MNLVLVRIHCQFAGITVATGPSTQLTQSSCSKLPPKEQIQDEIGVSVGVIGSDPLMQVMTSHLWAPEWYLGVHCSYQVACEHVTTIYFDYPHL